MARSAHVRLDGLNDLSGYLGVLGPASRRAARLAINDTARKTRTAGSRAVRKQINLSAGYVNQSLRLTKTATATSLSAVISAQVRPVRLARFGARQLTRKAVGTAAGDPSRAIPAGRKAAGVSVKVKRGGKRQRMRGAFLIPLQNTSVSGVFVRTGQGRGDIEHLYGPSVDQVWREVREEVAPDSQARLSREFRRQLRRLA